MKLLCATQFHTMSSEIVSHYCAYIYKIRSHFLIPCCENMSHFILTWRCLLKHIFKFSSGQHFQYNFRYNICFQCMCIYIYVCMYKLFQIETAYGIKLFFSKSQKYATQFRTFLEEIVSCATHFHRQDHEIVLHCFALIYEIRSRATQFRFCMRSNFRDTIAFSRFVACI